MGLMATEKTAVLVITAFIAVLMAATLARSGRVDRDPGSSPGEPAASKDPWVESQADEDRSLQLVNEPEDPVRGTPLDARRRYTIVAGDNLETIARRQLGSRGRVSEILAANPGLRARALPVGQQIWLPGGPRESDRGPTTPVTPGLSLAGDKIHVVARGESLGSIARRHYARSGAWKDIYEANRDQITDPDRLSAGQRLRIPPLGTGRRAPRP